MADSLRVDTEQLHALGTKLGTVRDRLAETKNRLESQRASIGAPSVANALSGFEDHWNRGRRQITEKADALSQMLIDSAENYVDTDGQLADSLTTEQTGDAPAKAVGKHG